MLRRVGLGAVIVVMAGAFMFMGLQRVSAAASCFTDVDDAAWYEPYVCAMATINVLTGYPDGSFNPNGNITRAEVAVVADRLVNNSVVNAGTLDGIDSVWFQPATMTYDAVSSFPVTTNGEYTVAEAAMTTKTITFCSVFFPNRDSDMMVTASGYVTGDGSEGVTLSLRMNDVYVANSQMAIQPNVGGTPFSIAMHVDGDGGIETFALHISEQTGDTFSLNSVNLTVELIQDTRCEGFIILPLASDVDGTESAG